MTALQLRFDFVRRAERWSAQEWLERLVDSGLFATRKLPERVDVVFLDRPERGVCSVKDCGAQLATDRIGMCARCAVIHNRAFYRRRERSPERRRYRQRRENHAREA